MRVKICGIRNEEDLIAASASGADAVGFLVGQLHASPDFILTSTAARLFKSLTPYITPVIVTHLTNPDEIVEIVLKTGVGSIQLHGGSTVEQVGELRDMMPLGIKLLLAAHLESEKDFLKYMDFYKLVDGFVLDSFDSVQNRVGGTGKVHDWNLSAEFVKKSPIPVTLAGGLNPENIAEAIRIVRPYALDVNSAMKNGDGSVSAEKCAAFVKNARKAVETR